jgi:hypothetical protein
LLLSAFVAGAAVAGSKAKNGSTVQGSQHQQGGHYDQHGQNGHDDWSDEAKIKRGFEIAPVYLDLAGRNHAPAWTRTPFIRSSARSFR